MAKYYEPVRLVIPESLNYKLIWDKIKDLKHRDKKQVKDSIYLFLSFLYPSEIYLKKYESKNFYKNINSGEFDKLVRKRLTKVVDILSDYIDVDSSYLSGSYSKSYRLKKEYLFSTTERFVTIQSTISQNYFDFRKKKEEEIKKLNNKYKYLIDQYDRSITIDKNVYQYVNELEVKLRENISVKFPQQNLDRRILEGCIDRKINMMRNYVEKINKGEFNPSMSISNHRLNSVLTLMKRELRNFLLIDGLPVSEIDIKNSHSYILGSILNKDFFSSDNEFSFVSIYKDLFDKLNNTGIDNKYFNSFLNNKNLYNCLLSSINYNSSSINKYNKEEFSLYSIMWCTFQSSNDIKRYQNLPFQNGIYDYINNEFFEGEKKTESIKKSIMNFHNLKKHRNSDFLIKEMIKRYPSVNTTIEQINGLDNRKGYMSLLLQRVESFLLLNVGSKKLLSEIPNIKFFTVHDSIVVQSQQSEKVMNIVSSAISELTGIEIGMKIKNTDPFANINDTVREIWDKTLKDLNLNKL